ncbi:MAG TPA: hypothetical protein VF992_11225 [Thermoplasmata archaeon]
MGESSDRRRLKVEIIAEVLRKLHYTWKDGKPATPYGLEKHLGLQGKRLRTARWGDMTGIPRGTNEGS